MPYALSKNANLGESGLTVYASLLDTGLSTVVGHTDMATVELVGSGIYYLPKTDYPDGFRGTLVFHTGTIAAGDNETLAATSINPQEAEHVDAPVSSRLASADYTTPPTPAQIEAALLDEGDGQQLIDAILQVINNNLDLPALELTAIAQRVRTELATELARIDAAVSSRLASSGYTSPPTLRQQADYVYPSGQTPPVGSLGDLLNNDTLTMTDIQTAAEDAIDAKGLTGGGGGPGGGAGADQVTVLIQAGGSPVGDAQVWITTDAVGASVYASGITDSSGEALFLLDAGNTYYLWAQKGGFNLPRGQAFVAEAD